MPTCHTIYAWTRIAIIFQNCSKKPDRKLFFMEMEWPRERDQIKYASTIGLDPEHKKRKPALIYLQNRFRLVEDNQNY